MATTVGQLKNRVDANSNIISGIMDGGFDESTVKKNNELLNRIRTTLSNYGIFSKEQTGLSLLTLLNNGLIEKREVKTKDGKVETKKLINLDSLLNNSENSIALNAILANESNRLELYKDYQRIYDLIPQMAIAVDRYVDNIISPDDLTKVSASASYEGTLVNEKEKKEVFNDLTNIDKKYEISKKMTKIIKESLIKGDAFYAVISVRDRVNAILAEQEQDKALREAASKDMELSNSELESTPILLESTFFRSDAEDYVEKKFRSLENKLKLLGEDTELYKEKHKQLLNTKQRSLEIYNKYGTTVANIINENVIIADSSSIINEESEIIDSYMNSGGNPTLGSQKIPSVHSPVGIYNKYAKVKTKRDEKSGFRVYSEPRDQNSDDTKEDLKIKGSILKRLEPERIVKLERDGIEFGYLYFENYEDSYLLNSITYETDVKVFDQIFGKINSREELDKKNLIYNMFIRGISQRINKATLEKFPEFTSAICQLLDMDNIIQKQIRITYFRPEEVVHFGNDDSDDCYYESLFKRILFTAKMYLSMLTTALLYKIVRAPSKRIFYIEVGLDNDDGEAVSSFVRDLKTKELKFNDIAGSSINNVLSLVSCFNDIYVPVVDNNKPIEVETAQEDSPNMDSDLADKFMKDMTSGIGIPHAYIADSENVQFSKALAMENLAFMRRVVIFQIIFGKQFTKLYQLLYANEYPEKLAKNVQHVKDTSDKRDMEADQTIVDLEHISVIFPCPTTLNMNVATEQSGTVSNIADFIIKTLLGEQPSNTVNGDDSYERNKNALFREIVKKYLPNIDWKDFEKLLEKAKTGATKDKIKKEADDSVDTDAEDSYADDEDSGSTY